MAAPVNNAPSFGAKLALNTARVVQSAADTPAKMTVASSLVGTTTTNLVGGTNAAFHDAIMELKPIKPLAALFDGFAGKVDAAAKSSLAQAERATTLFYVPMSEAASRGGNAVSFPLAASYASKVGFELPPDQAAADAFLRDLITAKGFPTPEAAPAGETPAPNDVPPADTPPADTPPADTPPADTPPAETPPADTPPADTPPADTPPADTPPADTPPADTPPAETPPADAPPADTPPADAPPADAPPAEG